MSRCAFEYHKFQQFFYSIHRNSDMSQYSHVANFYSFFIVVYLFAYWAIKYHFDFYCDSVQCTDSKADTHTHVSVRWHKLARSGCVGRKSTLIHNHEYRIQNNSMTFWHMTIWLIHDTYLSAWSLSRTSTHTHTHTRKMTKKHCANIEVCRYVYSGENLFYCRQQFHARK